MAQKIGSSDKSFGIVFTIVFFIIALVPIMSGNNLSLVWLVISIIVAFITFIKPSLLSPFNKSWTRFGLLLHKIISPIILALMYFLVFTPIGIAMRVMNKRPLQLKLEPESDTYWILRVSKGPSADSIKNQY